MSFVSIAKEFFKAVSLELDPYTTIKGEVNVNSFTSVSLTTVKHIQFAKYGRGPGKQPPINTILDFVKKKGIIFEGADELGTAWAIAKSISKKGTKNWKPNAPNAIEEALSNNVLEYNKKLSNFVLDTQFIELEQIYANSIPRKITLKI